MQAIRGSLGLDYLDGVLELQRGLLDDWLKLNQIVSAYPQPNAQKHQMETWFLQAKSKLARTIPVLTERLGPDCHYATEVLNLIGGLTSLESLYAQSEVAVKKTLTEWHRTYIAINECLGELEEKRRRVMQGERVMIGVHPVHLRVRKPLPWREIVIYGGGMAALIAVVAGLYVMRNFLGFWAPGQGAGIEVSSGMTAEQRLNTTVDAMRNAFDTQNIDQLMAAFADDFLDAQNRSKTELRALIQTYTTARGLGAITLDLSHATPRVEEGIAYLSPVYITAEGQTFTVRVRGKEVDGKFLITWLEGI